MSRGGIKITRTSGELDTPSVSDSNVPDWMKEFASKAEQMVTTEEKRQKEAVTVVDHSRERQQSVYHQMHAIMNGKKPLYSSVEEAVTDYQKKTGINDYLEKIQSESQMKSAAAQIIAKADADSEKKTLKLESPMVFQSHPQVKGFIKNILDSNSSAPIPAIIHMIAENFEVDGVSEEQLDDSALSQYISHELSLREKPDNTDYSTMGKQDSSKNQEDDSFLGILRNQGGF
jgi:hypothetical protein